MRFLLHRVANYLAANLMKVIFGYAARVHVLHRERADVSGGVLLAANHISHFDPFIFSSVVRRKIDWMAMAEFFPYPVLGQFLRAVDAFPAERLRADRATIRSALERLKDGRMVGIFPEGGIRDGPDSILEGAASKSGVAMLAHVANVPILPCVILGSDRLYNSKRWLPIRRSVVWIAFGGLIQCNSNLAKAEARSQLEQDFRQSLQSLRNEIVKTFRLTAADLPHPPKVRMKESQR
ncbi:MAG: lysophospholipid acyltransferase family protein [Chthoniobacterales bacterium]